MRYTRVKDKNGEIHLAAFEKEDKVFFLDELFPELKGKSLIDFVHMVNGDPQKAAQMICAADGLVHRIEEQEMLTPIERPVHDILCVGVNYTDHLERQRNIWQELCRMKYPVPCILQKEQTVFLGQMKRSRDGLISMKKWIMKQN